jgi:F-type H+-transporting ATPase subunit gamma
VHGDRGLAGAFNSNILRTGMQARAEHEGGGAGVSWYAVGRRGVSSLSFRKLEPKGQYVGITDRPSYADARRIAHDLVAAYIDENLDRVDIVYNHYISPLTQRVTREILLPVSEADVVIGGEEEAWSPEEGEVHESRELWIYEPGAEEILQRLLPDFVEITVYRALLESTASEHGARMTAMRSASENAEDMISDLTLEANRVRQAEITQEIMEVVAGAEALG